MGALTWLKVLLPILLEYGKEILTPGTENKRTSTLERLSLLTIVSLFCMLVYVGEQFFTLHGENVRLSTTVTHLEDTVNLQRIRITELSLPDRDIRVDEPPPVPEPYDKRGFRKTQVVRDEETRGSDRERMIEWINGPQ